MSALVSIGIPCLNAERWLRAAIESALAQTHSAIEVIVVDDGSTDGSQSVAASFGERVRVLPNPRKGATAARNIAWAEARGEWLQFLDADDYLEPEKIAQQLAAAGRNDEVDVIYSPVWSETWREGRAVAREAGPLDTTCDLYTQWLRWELPQTGGCLWRKSALAALGGWKEDQPCCQEHELYLRALKSGLRFVFSPAPGAVYRIWSEDTLCRKDPRRVIEEKTRLMDDLQNWMESRGLWKGEHARAAGQACFEMARTLAVSDLAQADAYFCERQRRGLIRLAGPAAPRGYRLAHRFLGFAGAERLAAARR